MRILDRYIVREFMKPFGYSLAVFTTLMLISQLFEKMDLFITNQVDIKTIIMYLCYRIPFWLSQIAPVSTLLATLFCLNNLSKNNEFTAMKAGGLNLYRIFMPLIVIATLISIIAFLFNDIIIPRTTQKAQYIEMIKMHRKSSLFPMKLYNIIIYGSHRRIYNIRYFDGEKNIIDNVSMDEFDKEYTLLYQLHARSAVWDKDHWIFKDGVFREFDKSGKGILNEERFTSKIVPLDEKPEDFLHQKTQSYEMSFMELKEYINNFKKRGLPAHRQTIELYLKVAFPFTNLIMMLLGIPFAVVSKRSGKMVNFGIAVLVGFIYWGAIEIGHALGENKVLPPILAAWIANIVFGIISIGMITRVRK